MTRGSRRLIKPTLLIALVALLGLAISSATAEVVTKSGNLETTIEGKFTPKKLPKKTYAPIKLDLEGSMATTDKSHVPALKTIYLEFDRNGKLNTKGLPTCSVGKLQSTLTAQAKKACASSLVGTGRVTAEIALAEQAPFSAGGPLLIFNGKPKGGKQVLIFHVYAKVPAPTTVVTTAVIGKGKGPYGLSATVAIPSITSGQGSLTSFKASLKKNWNHKGKKQSLILARCPTGQLKARGDFTFVSGDKLSGSLTKPCTPGK